MFEIKTHLQRFGSIIIIILILAIHLISLMRFPPPHGDEAWMASRAMEFLQSGSSFGQLDAGVLDQYTGYEHFYPWLSTAIQSLGLLIFGSPSLLAIRFVSFIIGSILLISIYWIGSALDGNRLGILGVAFTAFSFPFFLSSHFGRPDIIAAAFGFMGIALYLNNRSANIWLSTLTGLIVALAFEVHANAAIYGLTIFVLYFYKDKLRIFRKSDFWGFIIGTWIGIAFYLTLHVFPNPQTFLKLNQLIFSLTHIPPLFTGDAIVMLNAFADMATMVIRVYPQIIIGLWAISRFRKNRPSSITILIVINISLLIWFTLLVRNKFLYYYAIYFTPALSLLIASSFNDWLKSPTNKPSEYHFRQLIVASVILLPMIPVLRFNPVEKYQQTQSKVTQAVRSDDVIMGNQLYWFELFDHRYINWNNLIYHQRDRTESNLEDAFRIFRPDIFILDNQMKNFVMDEDIEVNYFQQFRISRSELESFLSSYAKLESIIENGSGNSVQIYRINWETSP